MQTSIADAGIQRPLVFFDLFHYPANEASAVTDSVWFPRTLSVRFVGRFSTPCRVSGLPALAALFRGGVPRFSSFPTVVGEHPIALAMALFV